MLLSWALFVSASQCARAQDPVSAQSNTTAPIRVSVERVEVGVIVTDAQGNFVDELRKENFHLFDNGVEQPLSDFSTVDDPAQIVMLVEAGPAVYLLESSHLMAAHTLLDGLGDGDRIAVARYNESAEGILDFTRDRGNVAEALERLRFNMGFGALNLSSSLSKVLEWLINTKGKKTIVLLSSGIDTSPVGQFHSLLSKLQTDDVRILAISLTGGLRNPPKEKDKKNKASSDKTILTAQQFAEADEVLKEIANATGGRAYFPNSTKDFNMVFAQIAQLVRHEYSVAFVPPVHDGAAHKIEVRVTPMTSNANTVTYRVDHRRAYLAPAQ